MKQSKKNKETFKEPAIINPQVSLAPKVPATVTVAPQASLTPKVPAKVALQMPATVAPKKPKPQLTPTDFFIDVE
jgi:hypothetical protein